MDIPEQINKYMDSQSEPKRSEIETLHQHIIQLLPTCKLWFLDGKDHQGKMVANLISDMGHKPLNMRTEKPKNFIKLELAEIQQEFQFTLWVLKTKNIYPKNTVKQLVRQV